MIIEPFASLFFILLLFSFLNALICNYSWGYLLHGLTSLWLWVFLFSLNSFYLEKLLEKHFELCFLLIFSSAHLRFFFLTWFHGMHEWQQILHFPKLKWSDISFFVIKWQKRREIRRGRDIKKDLINSSENIIIIYKSRIRSVFPNQQFWETYSERFEYLWDKFCERWAALEIACLVSAN